MRHASANRRVARLVRVWWAVVVTTLAATVVPTAILPTVAEAQISPGPLARPHKSLEGTAQCVQCHSLSRAPMATSCLNCHKDVKAMIDQRRGYHARLPVAQRQECASCHPDHAGEKFELIAWPGGDSARFDHRQTGWILEGKHVETRCEGCHTTKFRIPQVAVLSKRVAGTPWVGLETNCYGCHRADDVHAGALQGACSQCHSSNTWAPASGFDHEKARFRLTGKHADVSCDACHKTARLSLKRSASGETMPLFRPVAHARCNDCHADPHNGRLKGECSSCHGTSNWGSVDRREFNHAATRYPLVGQHRQVECAACHGRNNERPTPAFGTCAGCHADVHRGDAGPGRDCASCHSAAGFSPATFTVAAHAGTRYPLRGKHASVRCVACHTPSVSPMTAVPAAGTATTKVVRLTLPFATCAACHEDAHAGQPAARNAAGGCAACHTVDGFTPSTMSVASHATSGFALDGIHASTTCAACHRADRPGLPALTMATGRARFAFAIGNSGCASCHADPHAGRYVAGGARAALGCRACHGTTTFRPSSVTPDEHTRFGYALAGAHRAVGCAECHTELMAPAGRGSLQGSAAGVPSLPFSQSRGATCRGCHRDSHGPQFDQRTDRGACESCHTVERFAGASRFDHERDTRFTLAGAHAAVTCARCHMPSPTAPSTGTAAARRQYAGVSMACESCHVAKPGGTQ